MSALTHDIGAREHPRAPVRVPATEPARDAMMLEPSDADVENFTRRDLAVIIGVAVAASVASLVIAATRSVWVDEAYTWSTASRSWPAFMHLVSTREGGGALYSLLMFGWVRLGSSPLMLRAPSLVGAALLVPATAMLGRRMFNRRVGVIAALLVAANANVLWFGAEARSYEFTVLFAIVAWHGFVRMLDEPTRGAATEWVVAGAALVGCQVLGVGVLIAQAVALALHPEARRLARRLMPAAAALVAASTPWVALVALQAGSLDANPARFRTPRAILQAVTSLAGGGGLPLVLCYTVLLAFSGATLLGPRSRRVDIDDRSFPEHPVAPPAGGGRSDRARWRVRALWCWLVVPTAISVAVGLVERQFFGRYLLVAVPALALLGAQVIATVRARAWFALALSTILVASASGIVTVMVRPKDDWRDLVAFVSAHAAPGDGIVFAGDEGAIPFTYYTRDRAALREELAPVFPKVPWGQFGTGDEHQALPSDAVLRDASRRHGRLWVVVAYAGPNDLRPQAERRITQALIPSMRRDVQRRFVPGLRLLRFDPRGPAER